MSRSIVNELFIQGATADTLTTNGQTVRQFRVAEFESGNIFFWGSSDYTDGTYTLSFAEGDIAGFGNSTPISSARIIIPEIALEGDQNPLVISQAGMQQADGLMRQVEIRDVKAFIFSVIDRTNVTTGATIVQAFIVGTERSPVSLNQLT